MLIIRRLYWLWRQLVPPNSIVGISVPTVRGEVGPPIPIIARANHAGGSGPGSWLGVTLRRIFRNLSLNRNILFAQQHEVINIHSSSSR